MQAVDPTIQTLWQPLAIIAAMAALLKFFVVDKLKGISDGLNGHEKRIRRVELSTATMHSALQARGCLAVGECPLTGEGTGEEEP